ncbi:MAG: 30S ribosomal protein S24e [Candidatus Micrarchaeia archaeon]
MDLQIVSDKTNSLLKRREITFKVIDAGPSFSRKEASKAICSKLNLNPDSLIVSEMQPIFGTHDMICKANSYTDRDSMLSMEKRHILKRANLIGENAAATQNSSEAAPQQ